MSLSTHLGTPESEPIRRNGYAAASVAAVAAFFGPIAATGELSIQVVAAGIVAAATALGSVGFATKASRNAVYSPATAGEIMDAESVIRQAEGNA